MRLQFNGDGESKHQCGRRRLQLFNHHGDRQGRSWQPDPGANGELIRGGFLLYDHRAGPTDTNGQTTATITSTKAETKTITASVGATTINQRATVTFVAAAPNATLSTVTVSPNSNVPADGITTATITVTLKDGNYNLCSGQIVTLSVSGTGNTVSVPPVTGANGQTTATVASTNAETKTITAMVGATTLKQKPTVTFVAAASPATQLVFTTQPGSTNYGQPLSPQPVVKSMNALGNPSTVGLGVSEIVTLTVSSGSGSLQGTVSVDIGTGAGNGVATFSGLKVSTVGNKQLTASAAGLTNAVSSSFTISPLAITVTAVASTKVYDGTTSSAGIPTVSPGVVSGDTANFAQAFDTKNVRTGKTLTASGSVTDGNSGANYSVTFVPNTTGQITSMPITVTAVASTKVYDGTTSSAAIPTVSPGVASGDTANFAQAFDTKNVGTGKTLTASGSVSDNNGGANYSVTFVPNTTGQITNKPITVTAVASTKVYDGTTNSAGIPTVSPGVASGDTANFAQAFDTKNVGTGKTLTPSGSVSDNNGGANYAVTLVPNTAGAITALTTSLALVSSLNPSGLNSNVTFTATVSGVPPAADQPTSNVVFLASGVPFSTNGLVSGVAAASTASLPLGTNTVTAQYAGDGNFLSSSGSVQQVVESFMTCSQTNALLSIVNNRNGTLTLTFVGTPQAEYYVVASGEPTAKLSPWLPVVGSTNTVTNSSGLWQFTVTNAGPQQYIAGRRSRLVSNCWLWPTSVCPAGRQPQNHSERAFSKLVSLGSLRLSASG